MGTSLSERLEEKTIAHFDAEYSRRGHEIKVREQGKNKKKIQAQVRKLIRNGNYGAAMKLADPVTFGLKKMDLAGGNLV